MVSIGKPVEDLLAEPSAEDNFQYSIEFCGGTHLGNTSGVRSMHIVEWRTTSSTATCSAGSQAAASLWLYKTRACNCSPAYVDWRDAKLATV